MSCCGGGRRGGSEHTYERGELTKYSSGCVTKFWEKELLGYPSDKVSESSRVELPERVRGSESPDRCGLNVRREGNDEESYLDYTHWMEESRHGLDTRP